MNPILKKLLWMVFFLVTGILTVLDPKPLLFLPAQVWFGVGLLEIFCAGCSFADAASGTP